MTDYTKFGIGAMCVLIIVAWAAAFASEPGWIGLFTVTLLIVAAVLTSSGGGSGGGQNDS